MDRSRRTPGSSGAISKALSLADAASTSRPIRRKAFARATWMQAPFRPSACAWSK